VLHEILTEVLAQTESVLEGWYVVTTCVAVQRTLFIIIGGYGPQDYLCVAGVVIFAREMRGRTVSVPFLAVD
jgi:hypothetical protein